MRFRGGVDWTCYDRCQNKGSGVVEGKPSLTSVLTPPRTHSPAEEPACLGAYTTPQLRLIHMPAHDRKCMHLQSLTPIMQSKQKTAETAKHVNLTLAYAAPK